MSKEKSPKILTLAGIIIVVGGLRAAREIFIPIAVATLLSFLLAPLVKRLVKWRFPNVVAVLSAVGAAFLILGIVGWLVSAQVVNLADELPDYQENLREKIASFSVPGDGRFTRAFEMIGSLRDQIMEKTEKPGQAGSVEGQEPVLVKVEREARWIDLLTQYGGPLLSPIGMAGIAFVLVVFILLQRNDLRDRLIRLAAGGNLNVATEAVDDATRRVTRYLLMQLVVNATYGFPLGIGLYFIGVPNALLWGLLATLLRFLPFVGAWLAALFPIALSIAVDPGWMMPILVVSLIIILELISNNFVEPLLYGSTTGISVVALLFAALVWTWIWGPVGLFLSTPLTVCLLVIGKNVPALGYLNVILGSDPVLPPPARFYQRMLQMDAAALFELADEELESRTVMEFYEQVAVPALILAERDRHSGSLAERRQQFLIEAMRDLLGQLERRFESSKEGKRGEMAILAVPALDEADELTAIMFVQILRQAGFEAKKSSTARSPDQVAEQAEQLRAEAICLCAIPPAAVEGVRQRCRQLRERRVQAKLIAGIWDFDKSATEVKRLLTTVEPDLVATSFSDALAQLKRLKDEILKSEQSADAKRRESKHEKALDELGLQEVPPEELFDFVARRLAKIFDLPLTLVSIVETDPQFWNSRAGLLPEQLQANAELRESAVSALVTARNEVLVVEDMSRDERFADNPLVKERGIQFYAGAPLRTKSGHVVGALSVVNTEPRKVSGEQKRMLKLYAGELVCVAEKMPESGYGIDSGA